MTRHNDLLTDMGAPLLWQHHGESITYTPDGGEAVTLTALVRRDTEASQGAEHGQRLARRDEIIIPTTAAASYDGQYVADPQVNDTVTIDGMEYVVRDVLSRNALATLICEARAAMERTMPGYRRGGR